MPMILWFVALAIVAFGPGNRFRLEESTDGFGVRSHGIIESLGSSRTKFYPLPQSTPQDYARLRPEDLRINPFSATANHYDRQQVIGPYQIESGKIWFGNTATRRYKLFSPRAVARCEISAIEVQPDMVWLALDRFGESVS